MIATLSTFCGYCLSSECDGDINCTLHFYVDSYQLALELDKAWNQGTKSGTPIDIESSLRRYEDARRLRVAVIHRLARLAAIMASTYKAYLGVGLGSKLEGRPQQCSLTDKANDELQNWFRVLKVSVDEENGNMVHVTVRLYGPNTECVINRERELQVLEQVHQKTLAINGSCRVDDWRMKMYCYWRRCLPRFYSFRPFLRVNIILQVNYALGALYYMCNASTKEDILKTKVVDTIKRYASAVDVSFSNLAESFLDKHVDKLGKDSLVNCVKTSMSSKLLATNDDFFANLVCF
ncbi:hypothetical protein L2E82_51319 [Cichorium intybus]|nr:hypothetical protein L2E82_51319 [Cichorium intybus]